jgi:hypothetical protein
LNLSGLCRAADVSRLPAGCSCFSDISQLPVAIDSERFSHFITDFHEYTFFRAVFRVNLSGRDA